MPNHMVFRFKHPQTGATRSLTISASVIQDQLADWLIEELATASCKCQPSAPETNHVDCDCDDSIYEFELLPQPAMDCWAPSKTLPGALSICGNSAGHNLIAAERQRQIAVEGWSESHDDRHGAGLLEMAALCYRDAQDAETERPANWPWTPDWWKPKDRERNLVRAGALYLAAASTADRAGDYKQRNSLLGQVESCAILLNSMLPHFRLPDAQHSVGLLEAGAQHLATGRAEDAGGAGDYEQRHDLLGKKALLK